MMLQSCASTVNLYLYVKNCLRRASMVCHLLLCDLSNIIDHSILTSWYKFAKIISRGENVMTRKKYFFDRRHQLRLSYMLETFKSSQLASMPNRRYKKREEDRLRRKNHQIGRSNMQIGQVVLTRRSQRSLTKVRRDYAGMTRGFAPETNHPGSPIRKLSRPTRGAPRRNHSSSSSSSRAKPDNDVPPFHQLQMGMVESMYHRPLPIIHVSKFQISKV